MITIILVAAGLSMDNFAVSLASGCSADVKTKDILKAATAFVLAHVTMFSAGWFGGETMGRYIHEYDHWVAFGLLLIIGAKMVKEGLTASPDALCENISKNLKTIILISIATSIDALAVGLSLSFLSVNFTASLFAIAFFVFATTFIGFNIGSRLGKKLGTKAEVLGGIVLITIAVKILLDGIR